MNIKKLIKIKTPYIYAFLKKAPVFNVFGRKMSSDFYQTDNYETPPFYKNISSLL